MTEAELLEAVIYKLDGSSNLIDGAVHADILLSIINHPTDDVRAVVTFDEPIS